MFGTLRAAVTAPFQPIPDATQVHQDRLIGSKLGEIEVGSRVSEGRLGTIYRARKSGKEVTLEVLRSELIGDDEEVRAGNSIKCPGIADVFGFGQVPDGRRYRVMELLDGESLDQLLQQRGKLSPLEVAKILGQVAEVLQTAHSWMLPHGSLGPSSVFLVKGAVKLIDFGLAKGPVSLEVDLQELGALGFLLLTGQELVDGVLPPLMTGLSAPLDRLLRELIENRVKDATAARGELTLLMTLLETPAFPKQAVAPRRSRALPLVALAMVLAVGGATALVVSSQAFDGQIPVIVDEPDTLSFDDVTDVEPDETEAPVVPGPVQPPRPPSSTGPRKPRPVPSTTALMEEISRLDSRFRKQARPGDDIDQALYVLNKQRLRLSGSPTEIDRKDVARQLAGWRRSYLRR